MSTKNYTTEERNNVLEMYKQGIPVIEIHKQVGLATSTITAWVRSSGMNLRHPKKAVDIKKTRCSCGELIEPKFRFCPFCGKDVRSKEDILIEKLSDTLGAITLLPVGERDKTRDTINEAIAYIRSNNK